MLVTNETRKKKKADVMLTLPHPSLRAVKKMAADLSLTYAVTVADAKAQASLARANSNPGGADLWEVKAGCYQQAHDDIGDILRYVDSLEVNPNAA